MVFEDGQVCDPIDGYGGSRGAGHGGQICEPQELLLPAASCAAAVRSGAKLPAASGAPHQGRDFGAFFSYPQEI